MNRRHVSTNPVTTDRMSRGQAGLTIVELLIVISVSTIVLLPMFALVNQVLLTRQPAIESANDSKQMRLFRTQIAKDWAAARVIKIGVPPTYAECNNGNMTSLLPPNDGPRIALQVTQSWSDENNSVADKRVIYNTRPTPDPNDDPAAIDVLRRECYHRAQGAPVDLWDWGTSVNDPGGSQRVLLSGIKELRTPTMCNAEPSWPKADQSAPYVACDANVTIVGIDGQTTTVRLRQHTGRDS